MRFEQFKKNKDQQLIFESAGFNKVDVTTLAEAMKKWMEASQELLESFEKIPVAYGQLGGGEQSPVVSDDIKEQSIVLEVQRARHMIEESGLMDLVDRMNQFNGRLNSACENL